MSRETIDIKAALAFARERLGEHVRVDPITDDRGFVTGYTFRAGRHVKVFGFKIETFTLNLWVDGVEYAERKRARNKAERERLAELERQRLMVANYVAEGLGEV